MGGITMEDKAMDIFFHDLVPETQKEVLKFMGLETPEDGNYDVFPLTTITVDDIGEFNSAIKKRRTD
jgi:hypothetical protein